MPLEEIIAVSSENRTEKKNTLYLQNVGFVGDKTGGIYIYHYVTKDQNTAYISSVIS